MPIQPPKWPLRFLRWFCHEACIEEVEGDLVEMFLMEAASAPRLAAWKFSWRVITYFRPEFLRPFLKFQTGTPGMLKSYFTTGWRNILNSKGYSLINISGLAIGLAAAMLILLWLQHEMSYDRFHPNADRTYQLYSRDINNGAVDVWGNTPGLLAPELIQSYPEVEDAIRHRIVFFLLKAGENRFNEAGAFADPQFLTVFSFPILKGSVNALQNESGIVLTRSMAIKLFGTIDCLGQTVLVNDNDSFSVTAVMDDLPTNTNFEFAYLLPWKYVTRLGWDRNQTWAWTNAATYVVLRSGHNETGFNSTIQRLIQQHVKTGDGSTRELFAHPLTKVHLYDRAENGQLSGGSIETVRLFSLIAVLIVLIAGINFINLSTARSERRAREVGIRKIVGAVRGGLIAQFIVESVLLVSMAFGVSLLLVKAILPLFNQVVEISLQPDFLSLQFWGYAILLVVVTGIAAGSYPAFVLSSFDPVSVAKSGFRKPGTFLSPRKLLVIVQFTIAITLSICAMTVHRQIQFAQQRPAGYDPHGVNYEFLQGQIPAHFQAIKNELIASGAVTSVTRSFSPIVRIWGIVSGMRWQGSTESDKNVSFQEFGVDADMTKTFGMRLVEGREIDIYAHPSDTSALMLNRAAVKIMRLQNPVGESIRDEQGKTWEVVGVIQDFIIESPYEKVSPMIIKGWQDRYGVINYRFNPYNELSENMQKAALIFKQNNPEYPFECVSAESNYLKKFANERQTGTLASWFAVFMIFIACLGLFGLASYMAETRTREVGVRKVLGASTAHIATALSWEFLQLVIAAVVIAIPFAWYLTDIWLQSFEYRMPPGIGLFVTSSLVAIFIALATVSTQAYRAARMNPVSSLRK